MTATLMTRTDRVKRFVLFGALIGAAASLVVSLLMDILYADALNGTWRDAIARDFSRMFSSSVSANSPVVYVAFLVILGILAGVGALFGAFCSVVIYRFFAFMDKED